MYIYTVHRATYKVSRGNFQFDYPEKLQKDYQNGQGICLIWIWMLKMCPQSPLPLNVIRKKTASARSEHHWTFFPSSAEIKWELDTAFYQLSNHQNELEKVQLSVYQWWAITTRNFTGRSCSLQPGNLFWKQKRPGQSITTDRYSRTF